MPAFAAGHDNWNRARRHDSIRMAEPTSLKEAVALLDPEDAAIRPVAGGTALMLMMKAGVFEPTRLVSLRRIEPDYRAIALTSDGALRIGAMATLPRWSTTPMSPRAFPVITRTHADALQRAGAQRRARRRRARAWRSAHGPAAGARRARRAGPRSSARAASARCRSRSFTPATTRPCWRRTS